MDEKTYRLFIWDLDNILVASSDLLWGAFGFIVKKHSSQAMTPDKNRRPLRTPEGTAIEWIGGLHNRDDAAGIPNG